MIIIKTDVIDKKNKPCHHVLTILLRPDSVMSNTTVSGIPGSFFAYRSSQKATYFFLSMIVFASLTCSFTLNQTKHSKKRIKMND